MRSTLKHFSFLSLIVCICVMGQEETEEEKNNQSEALEVMEQLVVRTDGIKHDEMTLRGSVLTEADLDRLESASIGETINSLPGVRSVNFGRAVGRPQIHGLDGPRVKVLLDRLSTMDLSSNFLDHLVMIETHSAENVAVLTGPSSLLFGSGAIGGIVNVNSHRLNAVQNSEENAEASLQFSGADNGKDRNQHATVSMNLDQFRLHLGIVDRQAQDYDIPGFALSEFVKEEHDEHEEEGHHDHDDEHEEEVFGSIPSSGFDVSVIDLGLSFYLSDDTIFGMAHTKSEGTYGIPGTVLHVHHHEEEHDDDEEEDHHEDEEEHHDEEAPTSIVYEQNRTDIEFEAKQLAGVFESFHVQAGMSGYEHDEGEGDEPPTTFNRESMELRMDTVLNTNRDHLVGLHFSNSDFEIHDHESNAPILAATTTSSFGYYWGHHLGYEAGMLGHLNLGARVEFVTIDSVEFGESDYNSYALSALFLPVEQTDQTLQIVLDVSTRVPEAAELYVDGPHLATGSVERGNPNLSEEQAFSATSEYFTNLGSVSIFATAYFRQFNDYIYASPTGETEDELQVFQFRQDDVSFLGFAVTGILDLPSNTLFNSELQLGFETMRVRVDTSGNKYLPRMPTNRLSAEWDMEFGVIDAVARVTLVDEQKNLAKFEMPTDGYTEVALDLKYRPIHDHPLELFLKGRNLTDAEIRTHVSPVKDYVPHPGRSIEVGVRWDW